MQIRPAQLASHLAKGIAPLYVIHGDEPLLAIEAGDEIRAAARDYADDVRAGRFPAAEHTYTGSRRTK